MTYPQAREGFNRVAAIDSQCAMAHWGVAVSLFQPLWPTRPDAAARTLGWQEVEKAKSLQPVTPREQLFIAAAEAFFLDPAASDYWLRIRRWEQAMEKVYTAFPDDPDAATFYALAHLATTPADKITRANADRAAEILLRVYRNHPNHPGAMHYLVHANDVPGRERELLEITHKYDLIAPNNPHAIHMPTHIYTRLGDWNGVIRGNVRAARAALAYPAGDHGQFVWDEFCHAMEYLIYGYLQQGNYVAAASQLRRLRITPRLEPSFKTAFHLSSTQARYALERRDWKAATLIIPRQPAELNWDRATWPEAIARFARGLGAAHLGQIVDAKAENERLNQLDAATQQMGEDLFARNIRMLGLELSAWIAHAEGREPESIALLREAVELEQSTPKPPVTPGPTLPALELLGDLFLEQKKPAEALVAYQSSLKKYPNRLNSLKGKANAARALKRLQARRTNN
jgi:tetratricopeptide (TPR) repeat protein